MKTVNEEESNEGNSKPDTTNNGKFIQTQLTRQNLQKVVIFDQNLYIHRTKNLLKKRLHVWLPELFL